MVTLRKVDASLMDAPAASKSTALTPEQQRRARLDRKLKAAIAKLRTPADVYEVRLDQGEKPITIRGRLLRLAAEAGIEIAVRKHGDDLLIGLLTPERRTTRGRRRTGSAE